MFNVNINEHLDLVRVHFSECTPSVLVVTDGRLNGGAGSFGLSHFLDVLGSTQAHGLTPTIVHRDRNAGGVDQALDDLAINTFDVLFLFGFNLTGSALRSGALTKVKHLMQDGGGVFATGHHEDLGAGMRGEVPRVRAMR